MNKGFTLLELIVVVIIIGILATLGTTQYGRVVETGRTADAKARIGLMRELAYEYYVKNGTLTTISNPDLGITSGECNSTSYYVYYYGNKDVTYVDLCARRCTSGGKTPDTSSQYTIGQRVHVDTGVTDWWCFYNGGAQRCFGYSYPPP